MKFNKFIIVSMILLAVILIGAVNAAEDYNTTAADVVVDAGEVELNSPVVDEIDAGGDIGLDDSPSADEAVIDDTAIGTDEKQVEKLGASNEDALGDDYEILTPDNFNNDTIYSGNYKMQGEFTSSNNFILIRDDCVIDASEATFIDVGIYLENNVQISGLTLTSSQYLKNNNDIGAIVYVKGDNNILDGLTINYAPAAEGDAYGIYVNEAKDFQLLNSYVNFTGSSLEDYYEYAMRISASSDVLIQGNTIIANLPILDVDYNKGEPGLDTDLVLNTGIREVDGLDIIDNTFIANVVDRNGDYPTLDCVMMEYCDNVNVIGNKFNETDFITNEGDANYLNVLDMYYSNNTLVQGNNISVETTGGTDNAGTSYPIQLTGPYNGVVIDGNNIYANCGGPALGVYSQNYYGGTEITVQNNNIDITGLPTDHSWGLVSGIELQDDVARVYNNTITTKSITGNFEEGMNIYGISYAQALNENHNYDIRGNTIETEGQYTIYLLKAQDTTITDNYLVSSTGEGDDTVYIRDDDGNTIIENNHGAKDENTNIVTQDNFYDFFDDEGYLLVSVVFDELIFQGEFEGLVDYITIEGPLTITGDEATLYNIGFIIQDADDVKLDNLTLIADENLGSLIKVTDSFNVNLTNLNITYDGGSDEAVAIEVVGDNVNILNNTIFFESHVPDDAVFAIALKLTECTNALVDGNKITAKLPCVYVYNYDDDYYMMGSDKVNPVRLKDCDDLVFTNNFINSTTNDYSADFPTIQSIQIIGCKDSILDHNNISMIDEMTPAGMDNYLYGINFGYNTNVTFSNNNFNMSTSGGKDAAGTAYAFQGVESEVLIKGNNITSISNGPNLGIYVASMYGGDSKLIIEDNIINVTGYASPSGTWALVSGIEIQNGDAQIYNNTIYTYNVNEYDDASYIYGISYAQWMYGDRSFDIQDNTIYTEGKYTISVIDATSLYVDGNTLYAHELYGDDSINSGNCADVNLGDNLPPCLNNIVTQDNFYSFFDENGMLLDTIEFDELIFQGEFSNLVDTIIISDEITLTSDNAVLNNIALSIIGDDVTVTGFTLNENNANFTNNGGAAIYVSGSDVTLDNVSVTYNAPSEVEAKAIFANGADNFALINSEIIFTGANPGENHYRGLEVRNSDEAKIDNNTISAVLPAVPVSWSGEGIGQDLVLAVGIQGGDDVEFTNNIVTVNTNGSSGSYPTVDAVMIHSANDILIKGNNISHVDTTIEDSARYYYALDLYNLTGTVEENNIIVNTTAGVDRAGTAYPIQLTGPYTVTIKNSNLTAVSKGPIAGIYTSNWGGPATLTVENNNIDVTGYATTGNYALVAGIEAEIDMLKVYNNTITVENGAEYDDANQVIGVGIGSSYFYGDASADIKDNNITVDGKYAVYYAKAVNTNVTGNTLYGHDLEGDAAAVILDGTNNVIIDNLPESELTNIVTQDNFYSFFDEFGNLLDTVPFDELIFKGEFVDLASYITIDRALTITGDNAVLKNIGFIIAGEGVTLDNMTLIANSDLGNLIDIAGENAVIKNMNVGYVVDEPASAIEVRPGANGVQILNNNIYFESTVDDYAADEVTTAICVNSGVSVFDDEDPIEGLVIDGNNIIVVIPAFLADVYENEYYVMGLSAVNGVRINGAEEFEFKNNKLNVTTNRLARTTPTLQALYVASSSGSIDGNNISMIDTLTPAGKDVYLYAVELINDEELTISNNNFNLSTTGGKEEAGSAYAILAIASEFDVTDNNITTVSNGPNIGIYFPSHMGAPCDAVISGNFINVTGLATSEHDTGLVSGIEIQTGDVEIKENTIYTYNIGDYAEDNYIYGISYAQDGSAPDVVITNNTIYTEGHYAISFLEADDAKITDNYLISTDLFGDSAVEIKEGEGDVRDNLPTNVVTNDTFYNFFDENGNLLDTITFDELIFDGAFSNLTDMIVFNRPVSVISDNAVLNNIAIRIASNDVRLSGFALNADKEFADNNGALIYATGANIEISDVVANYVAPSEAEAIAIYANAAENFTLVSSEIIYEATNPGSNHNYGLEVRDSNNVNIADNIITAVLPSADVSWSGSGIDADLVLAVGIQGGNNVNFTSNTVDVTTNGGVGYYPTIDAVMIHSANNVLVNWNNITHIDTTTSDVARYYYSVDLHGITGVVENNNLLVNTTSGIDRTGTAYPIQLTGPFTVTVNNNNLTSISKGPNAGIYASNWNGPGDLTATDNNINVTGYATAGGYALVAGIEAEIDLAKIYNNTINVYNLAEYADTNPVYGVSMTSSYMSAAPVADIKDNNITVDGKYAVYYASAENTNVTDNTLYAHKLEGDDAAVISNGTNNVIENNLPQPEYANISIEATGAWIGNNATISVSVPNATGTVTIEINNKSYTVDLVDGVATKEIPAEDLVLGENAFTATYDGPEYASTTATGALNVVDGVVTQDTYLYYFNQADNGKLFDYIPDGATLDFQGSIINPDQANVVQMNVNKPVNIISTTKDAYVDLNTTAGSLLGESPGNSFAITYGGSGSNVTGINFHNTQLWFSNTHNVVLDNISNVVEDQRVGSGVGATSIRDNSTNVLLKNSYFYTRNNGGSTTFTFSWASNCTIDNCTVKAEGNVGNLIYLNIFNVAGAPSGVPLNNNNTVSNNKIYGKEGSSISVGLMVEGQNNLIVNNTLYKSSISTAFGGTNPANNTYVGNTMTDGSGLTAQAYSIVYGNNVTGALSTGKGSVAYDNVVGGKLTVGQDATVYDNTVGNGLATGGTNAVIENNTITGAVTINKVGTTFVGNNVTGTVTVSANNNVIKGNNITTTGDYAVDLGSKTGNNVTDNYLIASELKGDAAVRFTNENNIVKDNRPIKDGSSVIIFPFSGAPYGEEIYLTYEVENETVVTVVVEDANGNVITDGVDTSVAGEVTINGLVPGNYTITVINAESNLYKASNCTDTFTVVKGSSAVYIDSIFDAYYGEDVVVDYLVDNEVEISIVVKDADGNVITDGVDTSVAEHVTISGLVPGEYTITIINAENEYYTGSNATETFTVDKAESSVMIFPFSDVVSYGEEVFLGYEVENENVVTIVVEDADGNVITDGVDTSVAGEVTITGLLPGNYTITITNDGNDNITGSSDSAEFTVTKKATFLMFNDDELTYADNPELIMTLMDENGNIIKNALIHVNNTVGVYKYRTDNVGAATVPVKLKPGEYEFAISYDGSDIYEGLNTTKTVVVNKMETVISVEDTTVTYKANDNYTITVTDANGNPISGITVSVNNGAKVLRYHTGADGVANAPVTLKPGNYTFDVSFAGNDFYKASTSSSTVVVDKANVIIDAADLVVTYKDGSPFEATLTDVNGVAISGVTVKFDFMLNGVVKKSVRYHTDANGVASAPISIKPGDYECVVSFAGNGIYAAANVTKTLTINKAPANLEASNTEITYKDGNLTARLTDVDGNAISGATISFTQGTSTYRYHTDSNGVATAPIKLKPGEYNYTISFAGNSMNGPVNTTAVVKVNKIDVVLTAQDIEMTFKDGTNYTAKLTDANGNPIAGVVVKVNRTGSTSTYKYKTDSEGMISVPLNFKVGTYDFIAFIEDSDIYNPTSVETTVTITK